MEKNRNSLVELAIKNHIKDIRVIANKYFIIGGNEDDLFQEGMIGLVQGVKNYDFSHGDENSESFKRFVLMCAKRQIIDAIKHANRKKNSPLNNYIAFDNQLDKLSENNDIVFRKSNDPEDLLIEKEDIKEKNDTMNLVLSAFEKQILDMYLDGKKQTEISILLGKTTKSIDNTLQRIKNKLKGKQ